MPAKNLKSLTLIALTTLSFSLVACSEGPYSDYSDSELQEAHSDCENRDSMSPGAAITCDNIRRACEKRAKEKGRKVCF